MRLAILGTTLLATALAVTPAIAQPAAPPQPGAGQPHARGARVFGQISAISPDGMVVTGRGGKSVTVKTTPRTRVIGRSTGTLAQVAVGDSIRVIAEPGPNGALVADAVQDLAANAQLPMAGGRGGPRQTPGGKTFVVGTVAQVRDGALSISSAAGTATTVVVPPTARIERMSAVPNGTLAVGTRVLVQGMPNQDGSVNAVVVMVGGPRGR